MEDWPQGDQWQWQGLGTASSWIGSVLDSGSWAPVDPGQWIGFMKANGSWPAPERPTAAVRPGCPLLLDIFQHQLQPSLEPLASHYSRAFASSPDHTLTTLNGQRRFKHSVKTSSGTAREPGISSIYAEWLKVMSLLFTTWKNMVNMDSTHGHSQMVSTKIRLIIFFAVEDGEVLYSEKNKTGSWLWLRS